MAVPGGRKTSDDALERIEWQLDHIRTSVAVIAWAAALSIIAALLVTIASL